MPKTSYDSTSVQFSFSSAATSSITRVGGFAFDKQTLITAALISSTSSQLVAPNGAGILFIKVDEGGGAIAFPMQDLILSCALVAIPTGIVGEGKIQFSTKDEGFIIESNQTVGVYHYSLDSGLTIAGLATILSLPVTGVC